MMIKGLVKMTATLSPCEAPLLRPGRLPDAWWLYIAAAVMF